MVLRDAAHVFPESSGECDIQEASFAPGIAAVALADSAPGAEIAAKKLNGSYAVHARVTRLSPCHFFLRFLLIRVLAQPAPRPRL